MGISLRVLTLLQPCCGYLDLILDWDSWEQALCVCLASDIPLRATVFVLPEQSIEETYAWPLSTAFTSEHPSSLNPPNSSTKLTQCGPTLWLFFVNNTSVNIIQAAVEITLINPGNLNLPIDFSLPLILRSFVRSFLPCFLLSLNILMSTVY